MGVIIWHIYIYAQGSIWIWQDIFKEVLGSRTRKNKQKIQTSKVRQIIYNVKKRGDNAVINYEKKFSKIRTNSKKLKFTKNEVNLISKKVDRRLKKAIDLAFSRIKLFHTKQKFSSFKFKDNHKNELSYKYTPIENVGVYVPGGTASYPSTVLMNCIPAIVAGVVTLGVMQQIIRAFGRVEGSMQYLLKAWPTIIELASVYKRLREFESKINQKDLIDEKA